MDADGRTVTLAAPGSAVAPEGRAEKVAPQRAQERDGLPRLRLLRPRCHRERTHGAPPEPERHRPEVAAEAREARVDVAGTHDPRGLAVHHLQGGLAHGQTIVPSPSRGKRPARTYFTASR